MNLKKQIKKRVTFYLSDDLRVAFKVQAAKDRASMSEIITRLITRYLKEREKGR